MLGDAMPVGFLAVRDFAAARRFYEGTLGLEFVSQDGFALMLRTGPIVLRLAVPPELVVAPYTVFGWRVDDIGSTVAALSAKGVTFERYAFLGDAQTPDGVWTAPGDARIAWFKDPDSNLLSIAEQGA